MNEQTHPHDVCRVHSKPSDGSAPRFDGVQVPVDARHDGRLWRHVVRPLGGDGCGHEGAARPRGPQSLAAQRVESVLHREKGRTSVSKNPVEEWSWGYGMDASLLLRALTPSKSNPDLSRAPFPASHSGGGRSFCFSLSLSLSLSLRGNTHHPAVDRLDENRQLHGLRGFRGPPAAIVTLRCPTEVQVLHYCVARRQCDTWTTHQDHQEYKEPQSCGLLCGRPGHGEGRSARGRGFDSRGSHPTRSHRYRPISALRCGSHRSRSALAAHSEKEFPFFHHNLEMFILFNECKFLGRMVCRGHVAILPFWGG